jgi:PhnB protein
MDKPQPETPPLTPYLVVDDANQAIAFYQNAFGAELHAKHATPDGKKLIHAALTINGALLMLCDDFAEMRGGKSHTPTALGGSPVTLHLDVKDVDAVFERAVKAGAIVTMPVADQFWGDRYGQVRDPYGHQWSIATRKRKATEADIKAGAEQHFGKAPQKS